MINTPQQTQSVSLKSRLKFSLISIMLIATVSYTQAASTKGNLPWAVTTDLSLPFGLGIAGNYEFIPTKLNARAQWQFGFNRNLGDLKSNGFQVTPKIKLGNMGVYADWFPSNNNFRLTGGLGFMGNTSISANGRKEAGQQFSASQNGSQTSFAYSSTTYNIANGKTYQYNGNTYTLNNGVLTNNADVADTVDIVANIADLNNAIADIQVDAKLKFKSVVPYIGIGYGNPYIHKKWSFFFDFGFFLTGAPTVEYLITSSCAANTSSIKTACNALSQELNYQNDQLMSQINSDLNKIHILPNIALGVAYHF